MSENARNPVTQNTRVIPTQLPNRSVANILSTEFGYLSLVTLSLFGLMTGGIVPSLATATGGGDSPPSLSRTIEACEPSQTESARKDIQLCHPTEGSATPNPFVWARHYPDPLSSDVLRTGPKTWME